MHRFTPFAEHLSHIDTENARFPRNICIQNVYMQWKLHVCP